MTTDQLITKAIHAINTGQPNLAQLYMRKAAQQIEQHRQQLDPHRRQRQQLQQAAERMRRGLQQFVDGLRKVAQVYIDALRPVAEALAENKQHDYALAGPAK